MAVRRAGVWAVGVSGGLSCGGRLACACRMVECPWDGTRRSTRRRWLGSENQGRRFLTDRYHPDDPRLAGENHVELRLRGGVVTVSGWPTLGARRLLRGGA